MFHPMPAIALATLAVPAAIGMTAAAAQTAPATVQAPTFRSTLEGYQSFGEQKVAPWKDANDTVGRIGGWRAYAKEVQEGGASPQAPKPAASSSAHPHAGHAGHGK